MYKIFAELCNKKNVTPYRVAKDCGFSNVTLSDWKNGKSQPKSDKLQKIADYFNVSLDYLLTGIEMRMESKVTDHPCLYDLGFMDYVFKLWNLPPERKDPILRQIRLETMDYREETRKKDDSKEKEELQA